eukprot:CAMPEP_0196734396 /NCGR_PEP_ID=MMETSP1091-20130531/13153_1 /TAXON_ID=302021 /ORGANISM="Rhodomonas sp., Strain CCMP768" /LENGTH=212 /DNA_ID=CAMNT_0042077901 /DNA_START=63 /DNA_END=698 /DNA_ORIENTATION=+
MNFLSKMAGSEQSESDSNANSSAGIGGWFSSLKEKSKDLVEVYKRDLGEFTAVVKKDTSVAIEKTKETLEKNATGLINQAVSAGGTSNEASGGAARVNSSSVSKLEAMQADKNSFTTDPAAAAYAAFAEGFTAEEKTAEISQLLEASPSLAALHQELVPERVEYRVFWSRYFFRALAIRQEEDRKSALLRASELFGEEEDFAWDEDDRDDPA